VQWRHEADSIDVRETSENQPAQICHLVFGRNEFRQSLPGIARALNELDRFTHFLFDVNG